MTKQTQEEVCCPRFESGPWHEKSFTWGKKKFIKDRVWSFMYMPLNFGAVMKRLDTKVRKVGATIPDYLCLSDHRSMWSMDVYLAVDRTIPDAENTTVSGSFYSRVYEGEFKETGNWCKDFEKHAKEKGYIVKKQYMWYTTCPKCAKKYGKNYVVIIAQIEV